MSPAQSRSVPSTSCPLYSEFGSLAVHVRHIAGTCGRWFFLWAMLAALLSWLAQCHSITIYLTDKRYDPSNLTPSIIKFGFLREMNAGFTYLVLAPIFLFFCFRFVSNMQTALGNLAARGLLHLRPDLVVAEGATVGMPLPDRTAGQRLLGLKPGERPDTAVDMIADYNRRALPPLLLILTAATVFGAIVLTEFNPWNGGDHKNLAFGYIQADHFANDPQDVTLSEFQTKTGREVRDFKNPSTTWFHKVSGGPVGPAQLTAYWLFTVTHLTLQPCFVLIVCWFVFKAVFIGWLFNSAIQGRGRLVLDLDFQDKEKRFGCGLLDRPWMQMIYGICLLFMMALCSWVANSAKFSLGAPGGQGGIPVVLGQGAVLFAPLAVVLLVFLYFARLYVLTDHRIEATIVEHPDEPPPAADQQLFQTDKVIKAALSMISAAIPPVVLSQFPSFLGGVVEKLIK